MKPIYSHIHPRSTVQIPRAKERDNDGPCPRCRVTVLLGRMRHHLTWCDGPKWREADAQPGETVAEVLADIASGEALARAKRLLANGKESANGL